MRRIALGLGKTILPLLLTCAWGLAPAHAGDQLRNRWFFFHDYTMDKRETIEKLKRIVRIAKEHGFTGVVLEAGRNGWKTCYSGGFDYISEWPPAMLHNLSELREFCEQSDLKSSLPCFNWVVRVHCLHATRPCGRFFGGRRSASSARRRGAVGW